MKSCITFGEAWIAVANNSIKLFSALKNADIIIGHSDIAERVKSVLHAIKSASDACACLRLADVQVFSLELILSS